MTATTIRVQMAQRKDTAANWTAANPILLSGEIACETDTKKFKIGDGSTNWNSLAYLPIPDGSGNLTVTGNLEIGSTGSLTFEGTTADGFETTLAVTDPTADRTITLPDVSGTVVTTGDTGSVTSTMIADGTIVDADVSATAEIAVSKLANGTANQVIVTDGTDVSWSDDLTLAGNLTVNGTTTTINTEDLLVEDKNIIIGNVDTPTDVTADGGGITLKGDTDKTINWIDATDAWTSSERFSVPLGSDAAPSLTFTGDPNTGIYSPGADQVAISTSGTGRLFVNSSGNVGIINSAYLGFNGAGDETHSIQYDSGIDGVQIRGQNGVKFATAAGGGTERARIDSSGTFRVKGAGTAGVNDAVQLNGSAPANSLLLDASGRLLVGTSSNIRGSKLQVLSTGNDHQSLVGGNQIAQLELCRSSNSAGGAGVVANGNVIGRIEYLGNDGSAYRSAGRIEAVVDGTPGANDMPGRLVFSTTADEASSPTEQMRITNDGVFGYNQSAPVAVNTTATLTVANLKTGIITSTTAAAVTMTLPTGTLTEGGFAASSLYNNFTFEWTVINTGATNAVTVQGDTGHTLVGSGTVAAGVSGRFASRRTATNTFVTYRLS